MRAITVLPGREGTLRLTEVPDPPPEDGALLVRGGLLGICTTEALDRAPKDIEVVLDIAA